MAADATLIWGKELIWARSSKKVSQAGTDDGGGPSRPCNKDGSTALS
jgi:hypothetical protein